MSDSDHVEADITHEDIDDDVEATHEDEDIDGPIIMSQSLSSHDPEHDAVRKRLKYGLFCIRCAMCECCKTHSAEDKDSISDVLDALAKHVCAFRDVGENHALSSFSVLAGLKNMSKTMGPRPIDIVSHDNIGHIALSPEELGNAVILNNYATGCYGLKVFALLKGSATLRHLVTSDLGAFLQYTGTKHENIIASRFVSAPFKPAYVVVVDDTLKYVIIVVRGTLETHDILTDGMAAAAEVYEGSDEVIGFAHDGMLRSAAFLKSEALPHAIEKLNELSGYKLCIVGHSLGAGSAALLSVLIKHDPEYSALDFKCWAFASPPVLSKALANDSDFIITIAKGYDVITTFSMHTVFDLRQHMIKDKGSESSDRGSESSDRNASTGDVVIDIPITPRRAKHASYGAEEKRLYLAGKVLHIPQSSKIGSKWRCSSRLVESINIIDPSELQHIHLHRFMIWHHMPWVYENSLRRLQQQVNQE